MSTLLQERLSKFSRASDSGCVVWVGSHLPAGYGLLKVDGRNKLAHRVSYEVNCGPIPEGMMVCHRCDNPPCINPDHLFIGSARDNISDMVSKGRGSDQVGERNTAAKLTDYQVEEIRRLYKPRSFSLAKLAKMYGVSRGHVHKLISGQSRC